MKKMKEIQLYRRNLLFLNQCCKGETRLGIQVLETWKEIRPRESILCWESMRGCEERLTVEFWTRGGKVHMIEKSRVF